MQWFLLALSLIFFQASPTVVVSPDSAQPGAPFVVNGSAYTAGARVKILWDGANLGGTLRVGENGTFRYSGNVPADAAIGSHSVAAQSIGGASDTASATFTVVGTATTTTAATTTTTTSAVTTTTSALTTTTSAATTTTGVTTTIGVTTAAAATTGSTASTTTTAAGSTNAPTVTHGEAPGTELAEALTGTENATEATAATDGLSGAPGAGVGPIDGSSSTTVQEGSGGPLEPATTSDGSVEAPGLPWAPIALAALALGALLLIAVRRRSRREKDREQPAAATTVEDMAVVTPPVAVDVQAGDGDWTRDTLTLDPPGAIDGIVGDSGRLVGFGQAAGADGEAAQAAVWESGDGISWRSVAMLGPGIARLAIPWRDGLLVAAVHGLDERIATTCRWVDSAGTATERTHGDEPLRGVVEGGTVTDDMAIIWGRNSKGPRVWVGEDGATWRESNHPGAVDLVAESGGNFVAFGRQGSSRLSVTYSTDGISWDESKVDNPVVFEGARMVAAVPFAGRFVAAGTDIMRDAAATWTTEDGHRWHRTALPSAGSAHVVDLVVAGDRLLVVGGVRSGTRKIVAVWESLDAVSWRSVATPELFADSSANAMAVAGDLIAVCGTLHVERDDAQVEPVPVTWRSRVPGNGGPQTQEPASLVSTEEPEPMPAR